MDKNKKNSDNFCQISNNFVHCLETGWNIIVLKGDQNILNGIECAVSGANLKIHLLFSKIADLKKNV